MRTGKSKAACLIVLGLIMSAAGSSSSATAASHGHRYAMRGQTYYYYATPVTPNGYRLRADTGVYANDPWIWSEGRE
jgi:hypothetical protein